MVEHKSMKITNIKAKRFALVFIVFVCVIIVSTTSILVYNLIVRHTRYQYCLNMAPAVDSYDLNEACAIWHNEDDGFTTYYYATGMFIKEALEDDMVIFYFPNLNCYYQYNGEELSFIFVGEIKANRIDYRSYQIAD